MVTRTVKWNKQVSEMDRENEGPFRIRAHVFQIFTCLTAFRYTSQKFADALPSFEVAGSAATSTSPTNDYREMSKRVVYDTLRLARLRLFMRKS